MSNCNHDRIIHINAHSSDLNFVTVPHLNLEKEGYLPHIEGVCGGDDVTIDICLDCGQVIGFVPMSNKEVKAAMKGDEFDEDEDGGEDDAEEDPYNGRW